MLMYFIWIFIPEKYNSIFLEKDSIDLVDFSIHVKDYNSVPTL